MLRANVTVTGGTDSVLNLLNTVSTEESVLGDSHHQNSTLNLKAGTINIDAKSDRTILRQNATESLILDAKTINIKGRVQQGGGGQTTIKGFDTLTIDGRTREALRVADGKVIVNGGSTGAVILKNAAAEDAVLDGVNKCSGTIDMTAGSVSITGTTNAAISMAGSTSLNLKADNLIVNAKTALKVANGASVVLNSVTANKEQTANFTGDILVEDGGTAAIALNNAQSSLTGAVQMQGSKASLGLKQGAKWSVTGNSNISNLSLVDGGIIVGDSNAKAITVGTFTVKGADNKLTLANDAKLGATIVFEDANSSLSTNFDTAYELTKDDSTKAVKAATAKLKVKADKGGTIVMDDEFIYTPEGLKAMAEAYTTQGLTTVSLKNGKAYLKEGESVLLSPGIVNEKENVVTKETVTDGAATIATNGGAATVKVEDSSKTDPKLVTDVSVSGNLTLVGTTTDDHLVQNATGESVDKLTVKAGATLNLGSVNQEAETSGKLPDLVVEAAKVNVENITSTIKKLVAESGSAINIGTTAKRAALKVQELNLKSGSTLFLDPAWKDSAELDVIGNASHLEVANGTASAIDGNLVIGQNSVVTFGGTVDQASAGLDALNLKWGKDKVSAALYLGNKLTTSTGGVVVDGTRTAPGTVTAGTVALADNSLLMVNQATVGDQAIAGKLTATTKAQVGMVNATEGSFKLADNVTGTPVVLTDNQFVNGGLVDGVVTTTVDKQKLAGAVASMGVQQMARRADTVFANTIADRTAQSVAGEGVALWVDVGGERYEADDLDNGAQYKANMFYGAFGADVGVTPDARIGAAIQYGTGDSKSDNYGIKNDIDAVTFGLYGSYNVTDAAKIVGEFGWTHTTNDVTASERLLANGFDADILSLGVRGQHEFQVGALKIVPSVGVRVSRISTDSFNVGNVKVDVDDQTIVQVPLSVAFSANDIDANGWKLNPYAKVSFTPTFGDDEINVRGYDLAALDTLPVQGNFGLSATNGNVTFGAALSAGFGQDGAKNFGGKVGVKYVF